MALAWPNIVLIDSDLDSLRRWETVARSVGQSIRTLAAIPSAVDPARGQVRVLILRPGESLHLAIRKAQVAFPRAAMIILSAESSQTAAVEAFRAGADDFVADNGAASEREALLRKHLAACARAQTGSAENDGFVGHSPAMRDLRAFVERLAPSQATVLITGETGTGKDCVASLLHRLSRRSRGPLVALNCAAIPEALLEGELFGYERGAFSGALSAYPGKLKLADGGTLFLDEIGELSLVGQAKVLRAVETREIYRLGARTPIRFDVRIVAATNRDLATERDLGRFRDDLFYRLAVAQIQVPPLRDRPEDIAPIARHLLQELAASSGGPVPRIDDAAMAVLESHRWPGNVRELRNALEVALVSAENGRIRARDLPPGVSGRAVTPPTPADERARLIEVLARTRGNKSLAAQELNCSRMTLYRKLARYGLTDDADNAIAVTSRGAVSPGLSHAL